MAQAHSEIWAWNGTIWRKVLVDAEGRLQIDIAAMTLAAGLATAANQVLIIGHVDGIEALLAGGLPSALDTDNLKAMLYDGANSIDSNADQLVIAGASRGLVTKSVLYGKSGPNWQSVQILIADRDTWLTTYYGLNTIAFLHGFDGTNWARLRVDADKNLKVADSFGGNVYSKTMTMADNDATRFEAAEKKLRDVVIIVQTNGMLLGETGVVVYPVGAGETVGFIKVDISTLYFKNAVADSNGTITILGTEE